MTASYDLIVIGAGPGGYPLAIRMARHGWKVVLIEREEVGGTCLNQGCIPTKALLASAKGFHHLKSASSLGLFVEKAGFDWTKIQTRKDQVVNQLRGGIRKLLQSAGVTLITGDAKLHPGKKVTVALRSVDATSSVDAPVSSWEGTAERVCLAVGSIPWAPPSFPTDRRLFWTSNEALAAEKIPESLLIVGGGVIGLELGQVYAEFGCKVTIVEMMPQILPGLDSATARRLVPVFKKAGLEILTAQKVDSLGESAGRVEAVIGGQARFFDKALLAVGRRPDLGVVKGTGVSFEMQGPFLKVGEDFQTSEVGVFGIGDCIPGPMLAHKASYDAGVLADRFIGKPVKPDYRVVPSCVYTYPEIAWVGISEDEAKTRGMNVKVGRFPFSANGKALTTGEGDGQIKMLIDDQKHVVGAILWGPEVSNLITEPSLAMGLNLDAHSVCSVIHAHPTLAEATLEGLENALGCGVHS
ncbi:MAG: dihydrolipoyl dehydrogenase [Candidatus Ozemobacteraceae bacterium]